MGDGGHDAKKPKARIDVSKVSAGPDDLCHHRSSSPPSASASTSEGATATGGIAYESQRRRSPMASSIMRADGRK